MTIWIQGAPYASGGIRKSIAPTLLVPAQTDSSGVDQLATYLEGVAAVTFALSAGRREAFLHFCDPSSTAVGQRIFDVYINGVLFLHNFDIFANALQVAKEIVKLVVFDQPVGNCQVTFVATTGQTLISDLNVRDATGLALTPPVVIVTPPPVTPPPLPDLSVSAVPGVDQITVNWTSNLTGVVGWTVSRDGVDNTGYGAYTSPTLPAGTRTLVFDKLLQATYHLTVTPIGAGSPATVAAAPTVPVIPPLGAPGATKAGVFNDANDASRIGLFVSAVGHQVNVLHCYMYSLYSVTSILGAGVTAWLKADPNRRLLLGIHHFVDANYNTIPGTTGLADTSMDARLWQIATDIQAAGVASQVIFKLEEEYNYTWQGYGAAFAAAWRRLTPGVYSRAPGITIDSCVLPDWEFRTFYPGDSYLSTMSFDHYDWYIGAGTPQVRWAEWVAPCNDYIGFARSHSKHWAISEWGVTAPAAGGGTGGGDNAYFVQQVMALCYGAPDCDWQAYFDSAAGDVQTTLEQNPLSLAAYRLAIAGTPG